MIITTSTLFQLKGSKNITRLKCGATYLFACSVFHVVVGAIGYKDKESFISYDMKVLNDYDYSRPVSEQNLRFDEDSLFYYNLIPYSGDRSSVLPLAKAQWQNALTALLLHLTMSILLLFPFSACVTRIYHLHFRGNTIT